MPDGYRCAIVPASDTGAMEIAMWSLLGPRPVDCFAWESFGEDWVTDTIKQLKITDAWRVQGGLRRAARSVQGPIPRMTSSSPGTARPGGVRVPNGDWIASGREGLTICDATSAAFAMDLAWDKLDVATFSWQKVLGGEAAHGMMVLSPRAVARLESYTPPWPLPKLFA